MGGRYQGLVRDVISIVVVTRGDVRRADGCFVFEPQRVAFEVQRDVRVPSLVFDSAQYGTHPAEASGVAVVVAARAHRGDRAHAVAPRLVRDRASLAATRSRSPQSGAGPMSALTSHRVSGSCDPPKCRGDLGPTTAANVSTLRVSASACSRSRWADHFRTG